MPSKDCSSSAGPCFCAKEERSTLPLFSSTEMPLWGLGIPKPELLDFELLQAWSRLTSLTQDTGLYDTQLEKDLPPEVTNSKAYKG